MPEYLVRFAGVAVYQADHPKARREITDLKVHAPDTLQAAAHALRTTTGCAEIAGVDLLSFVPVTPAVEADDSVYAAGV